MATLPTNVPEDLEFPSRGESYATFNTKANLFAQRLAQEVAPTINENAAFVNDQAAAAAQSETNAQASANAASASAALATSAASYAGEWSTLTGSLSIPSSVSHNRSLWVLSTNLADVTLSEPGSLNDDWIEMPSIIKQVAIANNVAVEKVNYLTTGLTLVSEQYLYDATTETTYYSPVPLTGILSDVGTDVGGVRTVTVDGSLYVIRDNTRKNVAVFNALDFGVVFDADITLQTGTDNTAALQSMFDASTDYSVIEIISDTGKYAFTDQLVFPGNRTYKFGHNRGAGLALKPNAMGTAVLAPDRWYESNESLGRPVVFDKPNIHGNRAGNPGLGAHGLMLCNFRPILIDPYITECGGDGIHGPTTLKNGTPITFKAVGPRIVRPRIWNCDGDLINFNNGAYSDGWLIEPSFAQASGRACHIVKGSGWSITKAHSDTIKKELLVVDTASTFYLDGWYLEAYNNDVDGRSAFTVGGILSDGVTLKNITGSTGAGRTGKFINLFTSNNTEPKIHISDIHVDFDASLDGAVDLIGISTGSVSPTKLHVSNVSKAPTGIYDITGTENVDIVESDNVWNSLVGDFEDYTYVPGTDVLVKNKDLDSNIDAWIVGATGGLRATKYKQQRKSSGSADYDEVFPVNVLVQKAICFDVTVTSHVYYNQANAGQWVGKVVVSQDILAETPAIATLELCPATGTLSAPTVTLENVGSTGNNDYQLRIAGANSNTNARTTVIFNG